MSQTSEGTPVSNQVSFNHVNPQKIFQQQHLLAQPKEQIVVQRALPHQAQQILLKDLNPLPPQELTVFAQRQQAMELRRRQKALVPPNAFRPARRTKTKSPYSWTTGGMRNVTHVELINRGGYGEVHKVRCYHYVMCYGTDRYR
jgi:hypothetical protein